MASSNPNSPTKLSETIPVIVESPQDLTRGLDEEVSPFSMPGEFGDVLAGFDEQSLICEDIMMDVVREQLRLL